MAQPKVYNHDDEIVVSESAESVEQDDPPSRPGRKYFNPPKAFDHLYPDNKGEYNLAKYTHLVLTGCVPTKPRETRAFEELRAKAADRYEGMSASDREAFSEKYTTAMQAYHDDVEKLKLAMTDYRHTYPAAIAADALNRKVKAEIKKVNTTLVESHAIPRSVASRVLSVMCSGEIELADAEKKLKKKCAEINQHRVAKLMALYSERGGAKRPSRKRAKQVVNDDEPEEAAGQEQHHEADADADEPTMNGHPESPEDCEQDDEDPF